MWRIYFHLWDCDNFKRKAPGRNNHNAPKLIDKYNDLAREALSNGDKILSENYLQHADHFTRILNERESFKRERNLDDKSYENGKETNELSKNNITIKKGQYVSTGTCAKPLNFSSGDKITADYGKLGQIYTKIDNK